MFSTSKMLHILPGANTATTTLGNGYYFYFTNNKNQIVSYIACLSFQTLCSNHKTERRSAVSIVSYGWASDCRSRGREFDPGLVPYFRGD